MSQAPTIAVLGAAGLIGEAVARDLQTAGFRVVALARRFTPAQAAGFAIAETQPLVDIDAAGLDALLTRHGVDVVVNCIGVLQATKRGGSEVDVHCGFVERLIATTSIKARPRLLVHLSVPGAEADDRSAFALTKRAGEAMIRDRATDFVILRPGFVWAPSAFGGSALVRALAMLPVDLPEAEAARPFAATDVRDIARTVAGLARRWNAGERGWNAVWDVMERRPGTLGGVVASVRRHLGGPNPRLRVPSWTMTLSARAGDLVSRLGWAPPIRTTALVELRRGVTGDPTSWSAATGIAPAGLDTALAATPASVQERWFARLYFLKAAIIATLAAFWIVSGLIALTVSFDAAVATMAAMGVPYALALAATAGTAVLDVAIGAAIAVRRTCRCGLIAGIALATAYMAGAAVLAPGLWLDPLGAIVKVVPIVVLMLVALALDPER